MCARGRSPLNTKERIESIITSVSDCWNDQASSLKTDVSPLRDQAQIQMQNPLRDGEMFVRTMIGGV